MDGDMRLAALQACLAIGRLGLVALKSGTEQGRAVERACMTFAATIHDIDPTIPQPPKSKTS